MLQTLSTNSGSAEPLGFSLDGKKANFALFSQHATAVFLQLYWENEKREVPLHKTGDIWHVAVSDCPESVSYSYRCEGLHHLGYNPEALLVDPYAKILVDQIRAQARLPQPFNWQGVSKPLLPKEDLVIYEMHVRGFTKHASSHVQYPGTFSGIIEKIPYLKKLGINAVELMPIFQFDETYRKKKPLVNYWGYDPLHFFVPETLYAAANPIDEFKTMVRELHRHGIEVILDVVYNHTGEGKETDHYVNFRGIDSTVYYIRDAKGNYYNYSGCGNTLNTNHPIVKNFILDSLRYWAQEMQVDGFRFDLASVLTRNPQGDPLPHPPVIEAMNQDPAFHQVKLIAEPWDAAGLYQVGAFPQWGPWSEWNGQYRDTVRKFIKGTCGKSGKFASALFGSETIYHAYQSPLSSVNFITAHDGYTLRDLVTYQGKHNFANGEENRDGANQNDSWNCGHEGPTNNVEINTLRDRQMRNFFVALFVSQGIPMLLMGDEYGHTRSGNNNPYVQDNELNWFLWDQLEKHEQIFEFVSLLIQFRKNHPQLRQRKFFTSSDITWYNNWDPNSRFVAYCYAKDPLYIAFNANYDPVEVSLPQGNWHLVVNTAEEWQVHQKGTPLSSKVTLLPYSTLVAIAG